jgi:hypothetical protein
MRQQADTEKDELYKQIGQLKVELDFQKKELASSTEDRRRWIDPQHPQLSVQQQCELLGVPRSTYYQRPRQESAENLRLFRRLDQSYMDCPFFGSRRMAVTLEVNRKRIQRLMRILSIEALYPKPNLSHPAPGHEIYPAARRLHRTAQPCLEHQYYLHSDAWRLPLPGGRDGLVQPLRAQLGTLQYDGGRLLFGRAGGSVPFRPTGNLELRSGVPVHLARLSGAAEEARHRHQHGWTGPCPGQRFHRAPVAQPKVRTYSACSKWSETYAVARGGTDIAETQSDESGPVAFL